MSEGDKIVETIRSYRFRYADEDQLQDALAAVLEDDGHSVQREVRLSARDRIDLMVGSVGVEVKIAGRTAEVLRQLRRYATAPEVKTLVLVTSRARHMQVPTDLEGVPLTVIGLAGAGL